MSTFTYYLAKGLSGEADLIDDGVISLTELMLYVRYQVAKKTDGQQTPMMGRLHGSGEMIFHSRSFVSEAKNVSKEHIAIIKTKDDELSKSPATLCFRVVNVENWDSLNIREQPTHKSNIVFTIPYDAKNVASLGEERKLKNGSVWKKIEYKYYSGWVNSRYLSIEGKCE
jgi:hypothetical protein